MPSMLFFFFNDTATTEIYTLSLHDALPISAGRLPQRGRFACSAREGDAGAGPEIGRAPSELQSHLNLVCRLLLEKKKRNRPYSQLTHALDHLSDSLEHTAKLSTPVARFEWC